MTPLDELNEHEWKAYRKCVGVDPGFFYPETNGDVQRARRFCNGGKDEEQCPVRDDCLDHAMRYGEKFGVWGGTSERQRRRMRKARWQPQVVVVGLRTA